MKKDEAINRAFLAHDMTFTYEAGKHAFLRSLEENGLAILPIHPTPEIINAGYRAGGQTVSSTFKVWRACVEAAKNVDEILDEEGNP